jgi:hypothetical protein
VVIAIVIVLIIAATEVFSGGSSKPSGKKDHPVTHPSNSNSASSPASTTASSPAATQVSACDPTALKLVLSTDSTSYVSGHSATLIGKFSNPGTSPCTFSVDPSKEIWTIKSGSALVWSNANCTTSSTAKQVTIKAGGTKKVSTVWDGFRLAASGCDKGSVATNGEYTLHATLDGVTPPTFAVFHITS